MKQAVVRGRGYVREDDNGALAGTDGWTPAFRYAVTFADGDTGPDGAARVAAATAGITSRILPSLQEQ
ncbi:hypothetical protein AB0J35_24885 [Nonomuraea angiospora]|uniref:hypothetical protein n=1 Tax=Nonomuraea angiospora TaxID=46172 RepID=UPI0034390987